MNDIARVLPDVLSRLGAKKILLKRYVDSSVRLTHAHFMGLNANIDICNIEDLPAFCTLHADRTIAVASTFLVDNIMAEVRWVVGLDIDNASRDVIGDIAAQFRDLHVVATGSNSGHIFEELAYLSPLEATKGYVDLARVVCNYVGDTKHLGWLDEIARCNSLSELLIVANAIQKEVQSKDAFLDIRHFAKAVTANGRILELGFVQFFRITHRGRV